MSQSPKGSSPQEAKQPARRGWAAAVREEALGAGLAAFARAGFSDPQFVLNWPSIAGEEISRIASPSRWQEGANGAVLTLKCDPGNAVFLQHQTRALAERLNAYLGQKTIARIRCVTGKRVIQAPPPPHAGIRRARAAEPIDAARNLPLSEALDRLLAARTRIGNARVKRPVD